MPKGSSEIHPKPSRHIQNKTVLTSESKICKVREKYYNKGKLPPKELSMFMRNLRKTVKPLLWIVAVGFVASLFFTYARMSPNRGGQSSIIEVNGEGITYTDFIQAYREVYNRYIESTGRELSPEIENYLKNQVLSQLITNKLLYQEAKKAGIRVSDVEINSQIQRIMKSFGSRENFIRYLNYQRIRYSDLEDRLRQQIAISKLTQLIQSNIMITEEEAKDYWMLENEKLDLAYLFFDPERYAKGIKVDLKEAEKYYEKHKEEFRVPEKIKVRYILISPDDFRDEIKIGEEELKDYYENHPEEFQVEEKRRASHIFIKVSPGAGEEEKKRAWDKIMQIKKRLEEGADFAELARKYSDDKATAEKGGDLGFFTYSEMNSQFSKAVFSLEKVGQISDIVETPYGFHLIKLTGINPPYKKSFEEVKDQIREKLIQEKTNERARKEINKLREKLEKDELTFEKYAKDYPQRVKTTPSFSRYERLPDISWDPKFNEIAFSLKPGKISSPIKLPEGYCLINLLERKPSHIPSWKEAKEKAIEKLAKVKAKKITAARAADIAKRIKKGEKMSSFGEEWEYQALTEITRGSWVKGIPGQDQDKFLEIAFSLAKGEVSEPFALSEGYYIVKVLKREIPWDNFAKQKEEFKEHLLARKRQEPLSRWLTKIREKAKVVDKASSLLFTTSS